MALSESVADGHFAKKQILSKDRLISWSHARRFKVGLNLAQEFAGGRVLDYGCGDGTFLALLMSQSRPPSHARGAELHAEVLADCQQRLSRSNLDFVLLDQLDEPRHFAAYDAIVCMEVLEHMVDVDAVLDRFARLLTPSGRVLISVPVESGMPLLIKQTARRIAGWRGIGDYPGTSPYTLKEYFAGLVGRPIMRPVHYDGNGRATHDHKGFNWMTFRKSLAKRFTIERVLGSPLTWLTPHLNSQVWFIACKRTDNENS